METPDKPALILFSHGSLLCGAGEPLKRHARRLQESGRYSDVEIGYLNYSSPPFEDAVERCVSAGAHRIIVVPYFLVAGKFVQVDLPPRVKAAREKHPDVEFILAKAIGYSVAMADAVMELTATARPPERWRDDLVEATRYCEGRENCPLYGTVHCPQYRAKVEAI